MGEIVEAMAWVFGGIFWTLNTSYEKGTGRTMGLFGAMLLLLASALLCMGAVAVLCHLQFGA